MGKDQNTLLTAKDANLAECVKEIKHRFGVSLHEIAAKCNVTYQTIKNMENGHGVNARCVAALVDAFELHRDPHLLRRVLLGFLALQFQSDPADKAGESLLKSAALVAP